MAVLTTALTRLRGDFNTRFPNRDKASDGWIGDAAHAAGISGHNPDETGGGEYEDSDSKDEVRAIDVDVDFKESGATAQGVVDAILATPADLARLRYMIYNRRIWSRNTGWSPRAYTGASAHTEHIHFSGDPSQDESAGPWRSVLDYGRTDFMAGLTDAEQAELLTRVRYMDQRVDAQAHGLDKAANRTGYPVPGEPQWSVTQLKKLDAIATSVTALAAGDVARAQEILAAVGQVDEAVLTGLGALGDDGAADALRAALGSERAEAIARAVLAAGTAG